ncbi:hypothetical protein [Nannocystis bainbridge]|uniref:Uncharacterized protein n=1 Tax=Nannocystis bainbridge TaxID=2995303 RepID=A0ABT5DYB4_9BACT|nr:hypothetical protein [Nannocystis bainbridge]MDC0717422.1 hypothetical protein [Nannocystis bainbridge]
MSPLSRPWRHLPLFACVLAGCPQVYTQGTTTEAGTSTGEPATTEPADPSASGTTLGSTAGEPTTTTTGPVDPTTGEPATTDEPATTATSTTGDDTTTTGTTGTTGEPDPGLMGEWGHACESDDDCAAILGDKAVCMTDILGFYTLPGGYCTKECTLPDAMTFYQPGNPTCAPDAMCIGASGYFEACAIECTENSQCPREGYECRLLPQIGQPGDPLFCLMIDE